MAISNFVRKAILESFTGQDWDYGSYIYIGLSSTKPNVDGTGITEPTTGGYKRALIGAYNQALTQVFDDIKDTDTTVKNARYIYFDRSTGGWKANEDDEDYMTLQYFVLFNGVDASAQMLAYGPIAGSDGSAQAFKVETTHTVVLVPPNALTISVTDDGSTTPDAPDEPDAPDTPET
jgi:hypothetical protein